MDRAQADDVLLEATQNGERPRILEPQRRQIGSAKRLRRKRPVDERQGLIWVFIGDGEPPPPHVLQPIMRDVNAARQEMKAAGAWVFTAGLHPPSTATVMRVRDGQILTTDGPFAEGKEHIGGFSIIKAADLDADWTGDF